MKKYFCQFLDGLFYYRYGLCLALWFMVVSFLDQSIEFDLFIDNNIMLIGALYWAGLLAYFAHRFLPKDAEKKRQNSGTLLIAFYFCFNLYAFALWRLPGLYFWGTISLSVLLLMGIIGASKMKNRTLINAEDEEEKSEKL